MAFVERQPLPIRALVVDDEELARRNLTVLLRRDRDIQSIAECPSGLDAIEEIRRSKPDLVFLDVQMPECDGFDVLDYLLKPFDDARFGRALNRAKEKLAHYLPAKRPAAERLVVRSHGRVLFLGVADIDWIEAAGYYACVHVGSDTHVLRRSLSELQEDLGGERFTRIHRSIIVNLERIHGLELQAGGEYEVVLKSKVRLRLSRRYRKPLQKLLGATPEDS